MKNKKAVSEIVAYTLLIIIAVALAVLAYSFLKVYVPKERPTCSEDIAISIKNVTCSIGNVNEINLSLENKGLFNISHVFIRYGPQGHEVKTPINKISELPYPLSPGKEVILHYGSDPSDSSNNLNGLAANGYEVEVEPAVDTEKGLALCAQAITKETLFCN